MTVPLSRKIADFTAFRPAALTRVPARFSALIVWRAWYVSVDMMATMRVAQMATSH